jgi:hypothetical protein
MSNLTDSELLAVMREITTRDHAGVHFTSNWPGSTIEALEARGWIIVNRPVHKPTGLEYDQQYWSLEFTEEGLEAVVDQE